MSNSPNVPRYTNDSAGVGLLHIRKSIALAFLAVAVFLSILNILLIRQTRQLQTRVQGLRTELLLQPGGTAPPITGKDLLGDPLVIGYGQDRKKTVMLVFSPQCHACDLNWPKWSRALLFADRVGARVVGVNLSDNLPEDYLNQHGLRDRLVVAQADPTSILAYKFQFTPQTIVIDADARVQWVWTGVLEDKAEREFNRVLGDQLRP
jgi:hypothetical protein